MGKNIDCSVIVLSFNTEKVTQKCLDSLQISVNFARQKDINTEVIVVDNGSTDGSREAISKKYPWVKLIKLKVNTGFSGGNNLGMSKCHGKYILLLNSDAFTKKDTLQKCFEFAYGNPNCDVIGCKLLNVDGSLQRSAGNIPMPINTIMWLLGLDRIGRSIHPKNSSFFKNIKRVGWVMGAFMFMKREVYEKTHGFDEKIFLYMEEVEWCKRIANEGYKIWYVPDFSITHIGRASSGNDLKKPILRELQTLPYYFSKHYPSWKSIIQITAKIGVLMRYFAFTIFGNKQKAQIYSEVLSEL